MIARSIASKKTRKLLKAIIDVNIQIGTEIEANAKGVVTNPARIAEQTSINSSFLLGGLPFFF